MTCSECIAAEEPQSFFPLLSSLLSESTSSHGAEAERLGIIALDDSHASPATSVALAIGAAQDAGYIQEKGKKEMVEIRMALHEAAPRVRAAWGFYEYIGHGPSRRDAVREEGTEDESEEWVEQGLVCEEGIAWVDWYGECLCDVETLHSRAAHYTIEAGETNATLDAYVCSHLLRV